ncbi:speckle targeted PIP5K1A-regulated poly(A) polymerase isoform X2 [Bombina bombina]|uniref:speckle targeted PIP5K1A-regulated poly(A) polymerase isoform X2 n=1 Tax=Bombina bombina TaxID=8345 RepID=UPI00235A7C7D|nr:speckle targeted PIP5K1A-regulated poly(A) polymerase isoform X2 [Bombina bombina]
METESSCEIIPDVRAAERGSFRCLLCGVSVPNRPSLADHLHGRRHVRLCEERDRRQQQQERSVYVSGFPKGSTEEQLKGVFQGIGSVKSIVMDKDRGLYAIVEFESAEGVNMTLAETDIQLGGQRLRVKPREKKEFKKKKVTASKNLQPPNPEELSMKLVRCSDINDQMRNVLSLCSPSHYESRLRELLLSLLQETFNEFFPGCKLLPFGSSVNGFEISGCDLDLYLDLGEEPMREGHVDMRRQGQKTNGREGEKDMGEEEEWEEWERLKGHKGGQDLSELMSHGEETDEEEDISPGLSLQGASPEEVLDVVGKVLRRCVPGVHNVQSVPSARRPVIRFQHKTSGLRGDITLNNRLALRNSSYLRLCSDLDPRVPQLVYTIRYWARVNQLAGNPLGGGPQLNNYALTLLVLFFLQSRSPPVIPTLIQMREHATNEDIQEIDDWDCSFPSDPTQLPSCNNHQDLNLSSLLLSTRDGLTVSLPFSSSPPSWSEGFRFGPINVQDPFELIHNVCGNVSIRTARRFSLQCAATAKICRSPLYQLPSTSRPWGVALILLPSDSGGDKGGKGSTEVSIPLAGASLKDVYAALKRTFADVLLCTYEGCKEGKGEHLEMSTGKARVDEVTKEKDVFAVTEEHGDQENFKGKVENEDLNLSKTEGRKRDWEEKNEVIIIKKRRTEGNGHSAEDKVQPQCKEADESPKQNVLEERSPRWRLCIWHRVWEGRRKLRRSLRGDEVQGEKLEIAVSHALAAEKKDEGENEPLIRMEAKAQLKAEGQVQLTLTPKSDPYILCPQFFHFLSNFLPRMVGEILAGAN